MILHNQPAGAGVRGIVHNLAGLGGLGDAACGNDPCGFFDYIWVSDACSSYLDCEGMPPMTFAGQLGAGVESITQGTGEVLGEVTSGVAGAAGQAAQGLFSNVTTDLVLLGIGGLALFLLAKGKL